MKGLLIIDMQNDSFPEKMPVHDLEGVVLRINKLAESFRKKNYLVIHIQHDGTLQNSCLPGTHGWQLIPSLIKEPKDLLVSKTVNDSFYGTELKNVLESEHIDTLVIAGFATDFCVDTTVRSAINKNYKVLIAGDCHTTFSRSFLSAEIIIRHHNLVWGYLIPTKYKAEVKTCDELIAQLQEA
ncbi:MAG: isochorismatase family protein [Bacteroidales bacterium]|nr:isochorismatase family protein [Bacteroidales bacterium]